MDLTIAIFGPVGGVDLTRYYTVGKAAYVTLSRLHAELGVAHLESLQAQGRGEDSPKLKRVRAALEAELLRIETLYEAAAESPHRQHLLFHAKARGRDFFTSKARALRRNKIKKQELWK